MGILHMFQNMLCNITVMLRRINKGLLLVIVTVILGLLFL